MKTKTYPITCPSCAGTGFRRDTLTTSTITPCPACNGAKFVLCTETIPDETGVTYPGFTPGTTYCGQSPGNAVPPLG